MARKDSKTLSRRVLVVVDRDMTTKTPRVVWQHEIPILLDIFGEDTVTEVDPKTMDEGYTPKASADMLIYNKRQDAFPRPSESVGIGYVFHGDPQGEYARLASAYGKHADVDMVVVEHVYGRFQTGRFAEIVGQASFEDMPAAQLRDLIIAHGYLPQVSHDASDEERKAADEARRNLFSLGQAELVALAENVAGALA